MSPPLLCTACIGLGEADCILAAECLRPSEEASMRDLLTECSPAYDCSGVTSNHCRASCVATQRTDSETRQQEQNDRSSLLVLHNHTSAHTHISTHLVGRSTNQGRACDIGVAALRVVLRSHPRAILVAGAQRPLVVQHCALSRMMQRRGRTLSARGLARTLIRAALG
eukprot:3527677-Rhodomonas_salina.3